MGEGSWEVREGRWERRGERGKVGEMRWERRGGSRGRWEKRKERWE